MDFVAPPMDFVAPPMNLGQNDKNPRLSDICDIWGAQKRPFRINGSDKIRLFQPSLHGVV